jgi:uncharacterized protein (TIGR03083 family)
MDYLPLLRADVDAVLDVVARASLDEPVVACPGWTVRGLVEHLGNVHRWATAIVSSGQAQEEPLESPSNLAAWFADGASGLLTTLCSVDPAEPCWSFTSDKTKGFWVRRQALETLLHRWDAQRAVGEPGLLDPALAGDGVAEVVELMTPRQVRLGRIAPLPFAVELAATDTDGRWVLGDGEVGASVEASAEVLLLLMWHRVDPGDPRVRTTGPATDVLRLALTP